MEDSTDIFIICRICLKDGDMVPIFNTVENSLHVLISDMITLCCGINLINADLPSNICHTCLFDLRIAYNLRKTSEQSEAILQAACGNPEGEVDDALPSTEEVLLAQDEDLIKEVSENESTESVYLNEQDEFQMVEGAEEAVIDVAPRSNSASRKSKAITKRKAIRQPRDKDNTALFCELCNKHFSRADTYSTHIKRHNNDKSVMCSFCDKGFVNNFEMKRHQRIHTGNKPYPCRYCDKTFSDYSSRNKHHNVHTQKRPYPCKICDKSFNYSNVLQSHMTVHTGEKKHLCGICSKKFALPHHLKKHMETHSSTTAPADYVIEMVDESDCSSAVKDLIEEVK